MVSFACCRVRPAGRWVACPPLRVDFRAQEQSPTSNSWGWAGPGSSLKMRSDDRREMAEELPGRWLVLGLVVDHGCGGAVLCIGGRLATSLVSSP